MTARSRGLWGLVAALSMLSFAAHALALPSGPRVDMPAEVARTVSYSVWNVDGDIVRLRFSLPHDARRTLQAKGARPLDTGDIGAAILKDVAVSSRGGDCNAIDQGEGMGQVYPLALDPQLYRFEIVFECPDATGIVLHDHVLFGRVRDHINFAQVTIGKGKPRLETFTFARQELPALGGPPLTDPTIKAVVLGAAIKVLSDPLRLCGLFAILLAAGRWPGALRVGGAALAGYAFALAACAGGLEAPDIRLDRAWEALLIALIALDGVIQVREAPPAARGWRPLAVAAGLVLAAGAIALAIPKGWPAILAVAGVALVGGAQAASGPAAEARRWIRLLLVGSLAALDGFGQLTLMSPVKASLGQAAPLLIEITVGLAGAMCLILGAGQAVRWLVRGRLARLRALAVEFAAAGLAGAGLFWFASQLYSL